jgi:hypothetical protein
MEKKLDKLYKEYGFKKKNNVEGICIYLFEEGRYFGAEIIPLKFDEKTKQECEKIRKEYAEIGYATVIRYVKSYDEASNELYKSFFSYESSNQRLKNRYSQFVASQSKSIGSSYKYVHSNFKTNKDELSNNIIDYVIGLMKKNDGPRLIIIEASAGYGKTCASYEILNSITNSKNCGNPIITELSRNRGASIFRYVLLDEIDREYPTLDLKLVRYEIQNGRIPLIIDGFDELLNKSELVTESEEVFGEVEPMLDTIGKMLEGQATIILTTRKTAIFGGSEFDEWQKKKNKQFEVYRISIEIPRIKDWLGGDRYSKIRSNNFPLEQIANPVLLTYLKNLSDTLFEQHLEDPKELVKKYFISLMEREKIRQELYIDSEEQYLIFKNLCKSMVEFDISSDKRQFIKEIIEEENKDILEKALKAYPGKPSIETLTDKLVNHAILDRKGNDENMIGFINDFIFGNFIGEILTETESEKIEKEYSAYMVELGVTAFKVQNSENKALLWTKIDSLKHRFSPNVLIEFDISLKGELTRDILEVEIKELDAFNAKFDNNYKVESCVFINCKFKKCHFHINTFHSVTFIDCVFESCIVIGVDYLDSLNDNIAINCTQMESKVFNYETPNYSEIEASNDTIFQNQILTKVLELQQSAKNQRFLRLVNSYDKVSRKRVRFELERFNKNGLLKIKGSDIIVEANKIKEIQSLIKK